MAESKKAEKKVWPLSIFLIKTVFKTSDQVINKGECERPVVISISGYPDAELYIKRSAPTPPKWTSLFKDYINPQSLLVPGVSAALFITVNGRCFVVTFGQGGRFLLRDDVLEERFGLLCALNAVDLNTFRCVDVQSLDAIQSHTRIQSGEEVTPDQFDLDAEQDMLKSIVGAPSNNALGNRMAGNDSLSVSVKMDLADLPVLLDEYRKQFEADLSNENRDWVYNIAIVKNNAVVADLEAKLNELLAHRQFDDIWLSIPEIIDWTKVYRFMYTHGGKELHPDINLQGFLKTVGADTVITLDLLRSRRVTCADEEHNPVFKSWPVFKCLYAEVDLNGKTYILNEGKWFNVADDFVARTSREFDAISYSTITLPDYVGGGEEKYNESVVNGNSAYYSLLDKKIIHHGGAHGKIEVCDLLSLDKHLIHVKIYGKSSVFSHLFAQGYISGQLIQIDGKFRQKVRDKLQTPFAHFFDPVTKPMQDEFTIVYAVISDAPGAKLRLPFFSKVNLVNTSRVLRGFGFKVELLKISVDETYAKTVKAPPASAKKKRQSKKKALDVTDFC